MTTSTHKTEGVNRTKTVRFYPFVFTGEVPCKEVRTPLTSITFSEERDEETCYGYCDQYQPHAVRRMYDYKKDRHFDLRWDKAGNLGQVSTADREDQFESARFLFWTEDNRMHAAVDEKYYSYYVYDYSGERRLKLTGESSRMDVNANLMTISTSLDNPTLYPSPYLVLTRTEYTKHYYAGTDRVAACLGGGGLDIVLGNNLTEPTAPAYSTPWGGLFDNGSTDPEEVIVNDTIVMLQEASTKLFEQSGWQVNQRELNGNELNCIAEIDAYHAELHRTIAGIPDRMETGITLDFDKFHDKVRDLKKIQHDEREYVYYYHGDHLGSASWITDHDGNPVQHLQYLPFGEPFVDQHPAGYQERYTFTGKERDEETGYGYFGARYMDHDLMTGWLSVDPMMDKYPGISPYNYCAWNPVKLVDPDGREIDDYFSKDGKYLGTDNAKTDNIRIIDEGRWNELSENGVINHAVGHENSESFSSAHTTMNQKSQLEVYQHYNPTKCKLYATSSKSNPGNFGMNTTTRKGIIKIGVYLEDNFKGIAVSDHVNEIINMFVHEEQHVKDTKRDSFVFDYEYENAALMTQFNHSSWLKCRPEFRHRATDYGRKVSTLPSFILDFWDPQVTNPFK